MISLRYFFSEVGSSCYLAHVKQQKKPRAYCIGLLNCRTCFTVSGFSLMKRRLELIIEILPTWVIIEPFCFSAPARRRKLSSKEECRFSRWKKKMSVEKSASHLNIAVVPAVYVR